MANSLKQKKAFDMFSRLKHYDIVLDEEENKIRLGMKDMNFINNVKNQVDYTSWKIKNQYEYRPDLIAHLFFGNSRLWWVIVEYNEFFDGPKDFYTDRVIKIPDPDQVVSLLL
jgi:hypothetical protein